MAVFVSPAKGRLTSRYGPREKHPVTGIRGFHRGEDIAPPIPGTRGEPLYAALSGRVRLVVTGRPNGDKRPNPVTGTWNTGNCIIIDTDYGVTLYYGHPQTVRVAAGDRVKAGDVIGTMGDSGNVTGVHLHFEVWRTRDHNTNYDPRQLFAKFGVAPGSTPVLDKTPTGNFPSADKTPSIIPPQKEEDMPLNASDIQKINEALAVQSEKLHLAFRDEIARSVNAQFAAARADRTRNAENVHKSIRRDIPADVLGYTGSGADRDVYAYIRGTYAAVNALADNFAGASNAVAAGEAFDMEKLTRGVAEALSNATVAVSFPIPDNHGQEIE